VNAVPERGKVRVKLASGAGFVQLETAGREIPVGSTLDTTKGDVHLFAAADAAGRIQDGRFGGGLFAVSQGLKSPLTTLSMTAGGLGSCGKVPRGGSAKVRAAKVKKRSLAGDVHGRFRVRGRDSVATASDAQWTITDSCKGTLTTVRAGSVVVLDLVKHHTVTLKKGQRYLARRGNR
jgi:hypothetical protein